MTGNQRTPDRYHAFLVFDNQSGNIFYEKILSDVGANILSRTDPLMIGSFISAITSYSEKMTFLSDIRTIVFNELKIIFIRTKHHIFVLMSTIDEPDADLFFKIKVLAGIFESEYLFDLTQAKTTSVVRTRDYTNFDPILMEVLSGTTRELPKNLKNALKLALRRILRQHAYIRSMIVLTFTGEVIINLSSQYQRTTTSELDYSRILSILYLKNVVDSSHLILKSRHFSVVVIKLIPGILLLMRLREGIDPYEKIEKITTKIVPELLHFFE